MHWQETTGIPTLEKPLPVVILQSSSCCLPRNQVLPVTASKKKKSEEANQSAATCVNQYELNKFASFICINGPGWKPVQGPLLSQQPLSSVSSEALWVYCQRLVFRLPLAHPQHIAAFAHFFFFLSAIKFLFHKEICWPCLYDSKVKFTK